MGVSLLAYVVTFFIFCINYVFTLCAVIFPKWLTFVTPVPFYMETNYGLFKLCRRPFPSSEHGDCQEDGFCELWRAAAAGMVIATILGGLTLFGILATMCSERRKRSQAWAPLSFMFLIYGNNDSHPTSILNGYYCVFIQHECDILHGNKVQFFICVDYHKLVSGCDFGGNFIFGGYHESTGLLVPTHLIPV
ncbi:hypothetical protein INT47_007085 [Mucor saturninus]|uniref:Uncharacterized protein n=1 Tax=Mucor saturninus TaxID=64648 RepID=A0A8H7QPB4_9FUNG|nr:hypothetical protein INT47_007085 [Mucor saturninus]